MKKFKIKITQEFSVTHTVLAEDLEQAEAMAFIMDDKLTSEEFLYIGSKIEAEQIDENSVVTYEPVQDYLK